MGNITQRGAMNLRRLLLLLLLLLMLLPMLMLLLLLLVLLFLLLLLALCLPRATDRRPARSPLQHRHRARRCRGPEGRNARRVVVGSAAAPSGYPTA